MNENGVRLRPDWIASRDGRRLKKDFCYHVETMLNNLDCTAKTAGRSLGVSLCYRSMIFLLLAAVLFLALLFVSRSWGVALSIGLAVVMGVGIYNSRRLWGGSWAISGDTLELIGGGCRTVFMIKHITSTTLKLRSNVFELTISDGETRKSVYDPSIGPIVDLYCAIRSRRPGLVLTCVG